MTLHIASSCKPETLASRPRARVIIAAAAAVLMMSSTVAMAAEPDAVALWNKNCAACHGKDGKGKGKLQDLTSAAVKAKLDKTKVADSMKKGVKGEGDKMAMKPYTDKLSEAEIQALTDYVMALK